MLYAKVSSSATCSAIQSSRGIGLSILDFHIVYIVHAAIDLTKVGFGFLSAHNCQIIRSLQVGLIVLRLHRFVLYIRCVSLEAWSQNSLQ